MKIRRKNTKSLTSLLYICFHCISGQQCKQCKQRIARCYLHLWWYFLYISSELLIILYNILLGPWWMFRGIINLRLFRQIWEAIRVYFSPPISPRVTFFANVFYLFLQKYEKLSGYTLQRPITLLISDQVEFSRWSSGTFQWLWSQRWRRWWRGKNQDVPPLKFLL